MATVAVSASLRPAAQLEDTKQRAQYLHGPMADFFLLGGLSFLVLPILLILPAEGYRASMAFWALIVANIINHPHFAHSYQIFYRNFGRKLTSAERPASLRVRYAISGIAVPVTLIAFFAAGVSSGNVRLVALGGNFMAFFVGWHYVKQGYGMLMVDAVLKRRFLSDSEKKVMLVNAYVVWLASWLFLNDAASQNALWGLQYYSFAIPKWLLAIAAVAVATSTAAVAWAFFQRRRSGKDLPVVGIMAYGVTLYLWTLFARIDPLWLLVVPALHSIQYLAVVYRFQSNFEKAAASSRNSGARQLLSGHAVQMSLFWAAGLLIGGAMFWVVPTFLDANVGYQHDVFGPTLFLFIFWVIVNVHHYFLDSVMWRRDNPETKLHLFA